MNHDVSRTVPSKVPSGVGLKLSHIFFAKIGVKDVNIKIKVISNNLSLEGFFKKLQSTVNAAYMGTLKINDVVDIYHLYSLYNDGNIREVWSCNQQFVKRHEKYLKTVEEFKDLFNNNIVMIKRIM